MLKTRRMQNLQSRENAKTFNLFHFIHSVPEIEEVPKLEHLLKIVQNICLYQHILADKLSEQPIDFPGLLGT